MHQMQIPLIQKKEALPADRPQKAIESGKVQGDSFRTVLAHKKRVKKEISQPEDKKTVSVKKKDQCKKSEKSEKAGHKRVLTGKEDHKTKIKPALNKLDLKISDKKSDNKKAAEDKLNHVVKDDKKKKENIHKIEKKPDKNHTTQTNSVAALLFTGSFKEGKTTEVKEKHKDSKGKKGSGIKNVSVPAAKETSGKITVLDLRNRKNTSVQVSVKGEKKKHHKNAEIDISVKNIKHDQDQGNLVKLVTTHQTDKIDVPDTPRFLSPTEAKAELLKELQNKMNDRIVKESGIVLKDNNNGEIKLILKPESLGKVRIRLHLQDNQLSGKIFVNNQHAQDVFVKNMQSLVKAFSDRGFNMGSLDVSVGDRGGHQGKKEERKVSNRILGIIENSIPVIGNYKYSDNLIDLVV